MGQLSGLERDKIESEYAELEQKIAELEDILAHDSRVVEIIKTDLLETNASTVTRCRTEIGVGEVGIEDEDLIPVEDCVFTLTNAGICQENCRFRVPLAAPRRRGRARHDHQAGGRCPRDVCRLDA